jgi:hypothetical protein
MGAPMPASLRSRASDPELAIPCPTPGCSARERQPCTTPRGRRRTDTHQARKDAINERQAS